MTGDKKSLQNEDSTIIFQILVMEFEVSLSAIHPVNAISRLDPK